MTQAGHKAIAAKQTFLKDGVGASVNQCGDNQSFNADMLPRKVANKSVKQLDRPRPLKWTTDSVTGSLQAKTEDLPVFSDVLLELEHLEKILSNAHLDSSLPVNVQRMCKNLKGFGRTVDDRNGVQLDRYFVSLRNAARDERLDPATRLHLLEIIELRASGWKGNDNVEHYYKNRLQDAENLDANMDMTIPMSPMSTSASMTSFPTATQGSSMLYPLGVLPNPPPPTPLPAVSILNAGEFLRSSGKYPGPTKIPAKNCFKDEILIRNSDSGKVMGIKGRRVHMIEELSGTIVSFQRVVQGAKDRLVQITGPTEESIGNSKQLIEDTIRRNVSPIRELPPALQTSESSPNLAYTLRRGSDDAGSYPTGRSLMHSLSMNDATIGEYQYTVNTGCGTISLSGKQFDLLRTAKLVLEEYFAGDAKRTVHECIDEEQFESLSDTPRGCGDEGLRMVELPELMPPRTPPPFGPAAAFQVRPLVDRNGHPACRSLPLTKSSSLTGRYLGNSHESSPDSDEDDDDDSTDDDYGRVSVGHRPSVGAAASSVTLMVAPVACQPSNPRIIYTRHFLLLCSQSLYSKLQPKDISRIVLDNPTIHKKTPEFFDPTEYLIALPPSTGVSSCNSWPSNIAGSMGSSQDGVDEKDEQVRTPSN